MRHKLLPSISQNLSIEFAIRHHSLTKLSFLILTTYIMHNAHTCYDKFFHTTDMSSDGRLFSTVCREILRFLSGLNKFDLQQFLILVLPIDSNGSKMYIIKIKQCWVYLQRKALYKTAAKKPG